MIKVEKMSDKYMIISITKINDSEFQIIFARENPFLDLVYKGLLIHSFKTKDDTLYKSFSRYGKWLKRKDKDINVLLYLLKAEWKINSQVDFI